MSDLARKRCIPCEGGVARLTQTQAESLLKQLPGWSLNPDATRLHREFAFENFRENMAFLNRVADVAEAEGHHPDFTVHYNRVAFEIFTHAVGGLTENDFILAAKIDDVVKGALRP